MRKKIYIIMAFIIVELTAIYLLTEDTKEKKNVILENINKIVESEYTSVQNSFSVLANTAFKGFINKKDVVENFAKRDRKSLYNILLSDYKYLENINFKQIHFHLPNNHSFLRMHKPNKFGDDLTNIRYSINYVNKEEKPILGGLEMGKVVPGYRYVYPLNYNSKHIGSVETSFSVFAFSRQMEKTYPSHIHFIIKKDILNKKAFMEDANSKYQSSMEHEDYSILVPPKGFNNSKVTCNKDILKPIYKNELKEIVNKGIFDKKIFSFEIEIEENGYHTRKVVTFKPLNNIQNEQIGYFVVYQNVESLRIIDEQYLRKVLGISSFIILLFVFLYKQLMQKEILESEVGEKTAKLQEAAVTAEEHAAEIEVINDSLEERIKIEVDKNLDQERKLANQSKQAALGDMIGNIAHQWRQPLSAISTAASGMQLNKEMGFLTDDDFVKYTDGIIKNSNYLSQTIDDFRNFIKSDKVFKDFAVVDTIEKTLGIVNSSINNHKLRVIKNYDKDARISNYDNELQQVIINIFNNAKDALKQKVSNEEDRIIFIDVYKDANNAYINMKDTAGGIPESIMDKIFEPYFTTKHQSQGTGLGLYMSHVIVVDSMDGGIEVENVDFEYENKSYSGAQFLLSFKLDTNKKK